MGKDAREQEPGAGSGAARLARPFYEVLFRAGRAAISRRTACSDRAHAIDSPNVAKRLAANFVNLVHEATLKSYWRRKALWRFLRHAGVAESFLATWNAEESKRDFLDRLFAKLPDLSGGQDLLLSLARDLAQQESFPILKVGKTPNAN